MSVMGSILGGSAVQQLRGFKTARLAQYEAPKPSRSFRQSSLIGTNPNSTMSQIERVQMQFDAEWLAKNSWFGRAYLKFRINYCSPLSYSPNTGDRTLDADVKGYLEEQWETGGINSSVWDAFSRTADVEQPVRGDSGLILYRDEDRIRFMEFSADQLGELYQYIQPSNYRGTGLIYFSGMFFYPNGQRAGYKVYERGFDTYYCNPQVYDACDVIYFQDNLMRGIRGVTQFSSAIIVLTKHDMITNFEMDAVQKNSKLAAVVFNGRGQPDEGTYETQYNRDGSMTYVEKYGDGAVTEFMFNGDDYRVIPSERPGPELVQGLKMLEKQAALSLGMRYSVLVDASDTGGAPSRLEVSISGNELERIIRGHKRRLDVMKYVTLMDGVNRRKLPAKRSILSGDFHFPNLPTADAFKDVQSDIKAVRAGQGSETRVLGAYGTTPEEIASERRKEVVLHYVTLSEINKELERLGIEERATINDVVQISDNPQQAATAEAIDEGAVIPNTPGVKPPGSNGNVKTEVVPPVPGERF